MVPDTALVHILQLFSFIMFVKFVMFPYNKIILSFNLYFLSGNETKDEDTGKVKDH